MNYSGDLFVSVAIGDAIYKIAPDGTRTLFSTQSEVADSLAIDSRDNLFAVSPALGSIYKYAPNGTPTLFATGLNTPLALAFGSAFMPVPEPGSLALFIGMGISGAFLWRRRNAR